METTLWVNEVGDRYFLIPDETTLPPGAYVILSLFQDRRAEVSAMALSAFAISPDAARAHFQAAVGPLFEQAVQMLTGVSLAAQADPQAGRALLGQVLATLLGVAPEQINAHPTLLNKDAADLLDQIAKAMHSAAAPSNGQRAFARAQLRKIRAQLRAQGIPVADRLERIAEQIPQHQERFVALVEQCARLLREEEPDASGQLRELFDTIERDFGGLLVDEQERARQEAQRRREYRQSADDAIARSLRAHGITPSIDRDAGEAGGTN